MNYDINKPSARPQHADADTLVKGFVNGLHLGEGQPFTPEHAELLTKFTLVNGVKDFLEDPSQYSDHDHEDVLVLDRSPISKSSKKTFTPFTQSRRCRDSRGFRVKGWARTPSLRVHTLHGSEVRHGR
jgi:hypothetical protein